MDKKSSTDQFANYAIISVTESAANTLTYKKLETGISLNEKVAWIINRIEYLLGSLNGTQFNAAGDSLTFGLSIANSMTSIQLAEPAVIDYNQVQRYDFGTAADALFDFKPLIKDFSSLPGGGILVPPTPLYLFAVGSSLAGADTVVARIHYTLLQLAIDQYWELVESRRVLSS